MYAAGIWRGLGVTVFPGAACWNAGAVYHPGFNDGEVHHPGFNDGEVHHQGFQAGEKEC